MHINRFGEHKDENYFDVISYAVIAFSLWQVMKGLLAKISNTMDEFKVQSVMKKILKKTTVPVTEFADRYFIRVDDDQDIRILKDRKILIISQNHQKDLILPLTDKYYDLFMELLDSKRPDHSD